MIDLLSSLLGLNKKVLEKYKDNTFLEIYTLIYILILSISLYACFFAGKLLTNNTISAIVLSIFLTLLLHNIYRLVLSTSFEGNKLRNRLHIIRYISIKGFLIIIITVFISSSLSIKLFDDEIKGQLDIHKSKMISNYIKNIDRAYNGEISQLRESYDEEKQFKNSINEPININDSLILISKIGKINQKKESKIYAMQESISKSGFYIEKTKILSERGDLLNITIICIIVFLIPLYWFNKLTPFLDYQINVLNNHNKLILNEYESYKEMYINKLSSKSGQDIFITERYDDPPFNTILKDDGKNILEKGSLLKWIKQHHD